MVTVSLDNETLDKIREIAREAGSVIMPIYRKPDLNIESKNDDGFISPLTEADTAAHDLICGKLNSEFPETPILSEEDANIDFDTRSTWDEYWLVDPLDGTKEFIKKRDEFTVNIALIRNKTPVLGVVYAPAIDVMYYGADGLGARKQTAQETFELPIIDEVNTPPVVVVSKSHFTDETQVFLNRIGEYESKSIGSSLKLCLVAEGSADLYPRLGPTMEWDIAAGDAIIRASGGKVSTYPEMEKFVYSKEDLRNGYFLAESSAAVDKKLL